MPQLLKSAWQSVEPRPRWVGVKTQEEDWEKRGRELRHLWERLSACYFCHLQVCEFPSSFYSERKMPLQSQGCLEAGVGPGEVQERTGTGRGSAGGGGCGADQEARAS